MPHARSLPQLVSTAHAVINGRIKRPTTLQSTANELFKSTELLKSLTPIERVQLLRKLFPHLTEFPRGLLATIVDADEVGLELDELFGRLVAERVRLIDTPAKAKKERKFLIWLLTRANHSREAIRTVLNAVQLGKMIEVIRVQAPDLAEKYSKILLSWAAAAANRRRR